MQTPLPLWLKSSVQPASRFRDPCSPMASWSDFLLTVDTPSASEDLRVKAQRVFNTAGLTTPDLADGALEADVNFTDVEAPVRALVRRTLRMLVDVAEAKRAGARTQTASSSTAPTGQDFAHTAAVTEMLEALGPDASAMSVANVMAHGGKEVNVQEALSNAKMDKLDYTLQAEHAIWQLLQSESDAGRKEGRVAFSYVDLTSKGLLPMWLAPDAVGGSACWGGEADWNLDPRTTSATLGQLGQALKRATQQPKFFRSLAQWTAAFNRYALVAVTLGHLSWPMVLSHVDVIMRMAEDCRMQNVSPYVAILYDDLLRKSIAQRAQRKDPDLKMDEIFKSCVKEIREAAQQRLSHVLAAAGLTMRGSSAQLPQSEQTTVAADGALAKQAASAEALQRRAEAAARSMATQQEELNRRQAAMRNTKGGDNSAHDVGGKGAFSKKQEKSQRFFNKLNDQKAKRFNSGAGGGKGQHNKGW